MSAEPSATTTSRAVSFSGPPPAAGGMLPAAGALSGSNEGVAVSEAVAAVASCVVDGDALAVMSAAESVGEGVAASDGVEEAVSEGEAPGESERVGLPEAGNVVGLGDVVGLGGGEGEGEGEGEGKLDAHAHASCASCGVGGRRRRSMCRPARGTRSLRSNDIPGLLATRRASGAAQAGA